MNIRTTPKSRLAMMEALILVTPAMCCAAQVAEGPAVLTHSGMCDASAAVMLDEATFIVADDEQNLLAIYDVNRSGGPVASIEWERLFTSGEDDGKPGEADIEGAARIGNRIYWIASHGRNKKGKWKSDRHQFFAVEVSRTGGKYGFTPVGRYHDLALDMVAAPELRELALDASVMAESKKEEELVPKKEGLNIEGLAAAPDGRSLLIALRNPRPDDGAVVVPLFNPAQVVEDGGEPCFGKPIVLDLTMKAGGKTLNLSVRSIEYCRQQAAYLIVGGPQDDRKSFALFSWSGHSDDPPVLLEDVTRSIHDIPGFAPEAIVEYPSRGTIQLLSDDGSLAVRVASADECAKGAYKDGMCEGKHLLDASRRTFRSTTAAISGTSGEAP
jgi:hypothetical protein